MSTEAKHLLRAGIHRVMDDTKTALITAETLRVFGRGDWDLITAALIEWQAQGNLKILQDPRAAGPDVFCVQMLSYIDRASPWPDWP